MLVFRPELRKEQGQIVQGAPSRQLTRPGNPYPAAIKRIKPVGGQNKIIKMDICLFQTRRVVACNHANGRPQQCKPLIIPACQPPGLVKTGRRRKWLEQDDMNPAGSGITGVNDFRRGNSVLF